jgi:hypothetical protein
MEHRWSRSPSTTTGKEPKTRDSAWIECKRFQGFGREPGGFERGHIVACRRCVGGGFEAGPMSIGAELFSG